MEPQHAKSLSKLDDHKGASITLKDEDEKEPVIEVADAYANFIGTHFWFDNLINVLMAALIGGFGIVYMNLVMAVPLQWYQADGNGSFPDDPNSLKFCSGRWWWILVGAGTGLLVGTTRVIFNILDPLPTFIDEIRHQKQDPILGIKIMTCCCFSLLGGAGMGPEAGLGAIGGAVGHVFATKVISYKNESFEDLELRRKLFTISGMAAAFGSFLPSPFMSAALCVELGVPSVLWNVSYMKMFTYYCIAATSAFLIYHNIIGYTWVESNLNSSFPSELYYDDRWYNVFLGMLFGLFGAIMGLVFIIIMAITKIVAMLIKKGLTNLFGVKIGFILTAVVGGLFYGTLGYISPLTLGDGIAQLNTVVTK
eukprot:Pgem_evm1s19527